MARDPKEPEAQESEPRLRVVDRRWWAREESSEAEAGGDAAVRKPTYIEDLERQLADKTTQLQTYIAEHRRSLDEFEQVKLRIRRDVAREVEHGKRAILAELLEVLDNLDRAISAARQESATNTRGDGFETLVHGIELVRDQFLAKLTILGVTRVNALGQKFDATRHDAVTTAPIDDPVKDDTVVGVVREGYAIGDDVLRPASVVVGRVAPQSK